MIAMFHRAARNAASQSITFSPAHDSEETPDMHRQYRPMTAASSLFTDYEWIPKTLHCESSRADDPDISSSDWLYHSSHWQRDSLLDRWPCATLLALSGHDSYHDEAKFEDTVRQLGFTFKETYFRVQRQRGHLKVDQEIQGVLVKLLKGNADETSRKSIDYDRIRLGLLAVNADAEVLRDLQNIEEVSGDLRMMLGVLPDVELELTTELVYRKIEPNFAMLIDYALEHRPDIRARRLTRDKRKTELQLAKAVRYPNITTELGYMAQGPHGPDNQQQWALNLSVPLPVFNRNQGGIVEAEVGVKAIEAEIAKTKIQIQNEVAVAHRKFLHGRKIVDAMNGALEQAATLFHAAENAFKAGKVGFLDLENTRRSYGDTKESYLEAIFGYEENWLRREWAVGRDIAF